MTEIARFDIYERPTPRGIVERVLWAMNIGRPPQPPFKAERLRFAYNRCECGARLAYVPALALSRWRGWNAWDCSDILMGKAIPSGQPGSVKHSDTYPFVFWDIKADDGYEYAPEPKRRRTPA